MKTLLLAAVVIATVAVSQGAQRREVTMALGKQGVTMDALVNQLSLEPMVGFLSAETAATAKGNERRRIKQTYGGLEVVGATADVEVTRAGAMTGGISGSLAYSLQNDIPDPNACRRDEAEIRNRVKRYMREEKNVNIGSDNRMEYFKADVKVDFEGDNAPARLIYEVTFFLDLQPTPCRPFLQLDACDPDLAVIRYFDKIHNMTLALKRERRQAEECDTTQRPTTAQPPSGTCPSTAPAQGKGGNAKVGEINYSRDRPYCLLTEVDGSKCTMSSKYAVVIDLEQTRSSSGRTAVEFTCAEGYSDAINEAYGIANDAFYYGHSTGLMYEEWYGMYALGYAPKLRVHCGSCYENAFWNGRDMTFGDGCTYFYPLVNQDVMAHELGHGITDKYSDLYYSEQSGGINEAFSDMSGEIAELFSRGYNDCEIFKRSNGALRYFETPSRDGRSIDSANDFTSGMDVHYSSGVFNRAFFQLVTVQELPLRQAYEVFLQANKVIWGVRTGFTEGACGAMKAAYDLGYDVNKVKNAFAVVDIDLSGCDYQAFQQTVANGERREGVMVSSLRNPVFTLDETEGANVVIDVTSNSNAEVTVSVTSDAAGSNVISSGATPYTFQMTSETQFFKLSTSQENDITAVLSVDTTS